jgi:hypothetical protein
VQNSLRKGLVTFQIKLDHFIAQHVKLVFNSEANP